jgi:hypothetical protein
MILGFKLLFNFPYVGLMVRHQTLKTDFQDVMIACPDFLI